MTLWDRFNVSVLLGVAGMSLTLAVRIMDVSQWFEVLAGGCVGRATYLIEKHR